MPDTKVENQLRLDNTGLKRRIALLEESLLEKKTIAEDLQDSEKRYRRLFESAKDGILILDADTGRVADVNPYLLQLLGYTYDALYGQYIWELGAFKDIAASKDAFKTLQDNEYIRYDDLPLETCDGRPISVEFVSNVYLVDHTKVIQCNIRDITDRKRQKESLLRTQFAMDRASDSILWIDDEGYIVYANDSACTLTGYAREELLTMKVFDIVPDFPPHQWEQHKKDMQRLGAMSFESSHLTKDGCIFPVEVSSNYFKFNNHFMACAFIRDITTRKLAEEEILSEKEKLRILSDNAPFGMVLIDKHGHFTFTNARFTELFGYDLSDIPDGRTWFRKVYPNTEYRHGAISAWVEDFGDSKPGERKPRVFNVTCKDGTQKIMRLITSVLVSGDHLMICEDITELRRLESQLRQSQKMESIGTLTGGIAHDFNNIITALMGYASLIKMKLDKDSPLGPYVDQVLYASEKAADLTQTLLTFSRQQPVELVPLNINDTINAMKKLLNRLLTEDIELRTSFTKDDTVVMADRSQMDQILFNLVSNARDAMPKGGTLTIGTDIVDMDGAFIRTRGFGKPGRYIVINILDTGTGMDEATQEKIFDPFFTTKDLGKGTGLGLATVYGIVKQHTGYITAYSQPNLGAAFHIYLPAAGVKADEKPDPKTPIAGGKETILIAEDDGEVRHIMREALQEYGYKTIEAIDGEDATDKFKQHRENIDLIILDSVMPKKNGSEAYEQIRGIDPDIRALFTSGYTKDVVLDKGIQDKEFDFITKPLSLEKLLRKVREVLDRQFAYHVA